MTDTAAAVEHTKGPWSLGTPESDGDSGYVWRVCDYQAEPMYARAIAQAIPPREGALIPEAEWRANAHLIAAAPAMLAALEAAEAWFKRGRWAGEEIDAVRAAIAQARGGEAQ